MIGEKIHRKRLESGMSLTELAQKANVPVCLLDDIERGIEQNPHWFAACAIARALELDLHELDEGMECPPSGSNTTKDKGELTISDMQFMIFGATLVALMAIMTFKLPPILVVVVIVLAPVLYTLWKHLRKRR